MKTTKQATLSDDLFQGCIVAKPSPSHMSQHIKKREHTHSRPRFGTLMDGYTRKLFCSLRES